MSEYEVVLGIDKAARDTGKRRKLRLFATDSLMAAIQAEALMDATLEDPDTMYTHAMAVRAIITPMPAAMALLAMAA